MVHRAVYIKGKLRLLLPIQHDPLCLHVNNCEWIGRSSWLSDKQTDCTHNCPASIRESESILSHSYYTNPLDRSSHQVYTKVFFSKRTTCPKALPTLTAKALLSDLLRWHHVPPSLSLGVTCGHQLATQPTAKTGLKVPLTSP